MLSLNLSPIFKIRGIDKPYTFLVSAGFSAHSATRILNNKPRVFRLDHIELLCNILFCEPNDLLLWTPTKGITYADNFPLSKLKLSDTHNNWKETFATIPFKELKQITKSMLTKEKENINQV
jgi:DNA-binding Xre family transcriptional regulator